MATPAQVLANQQNAKLSTGPQTPNGKAVSRSNALKHGLSAVDPVLPHEDHDAFHQLENQYLGEYEPKTANESFLVQQLASARWKLDRIERLEQEMFKTISPARVVDDASIVAGVSDPAKAVAITRLERYRVNLERTYHRSLRVLRQAQRERKQIEKEQNEAKEAARARKTAQEYAKKYFDRQRNMGREYGVGNGGYLWKEDEEEDDDALGECDTFIAVPNSGRAPAPPNPAA